MVFRQWVKVHKGEAIFHPGHRTIKKSHWEHLRYGDVIVPKKIMYRNVDLYKSKHSNSSKRRS